MNWIERILARKEAQKFVDNAIKESTMSAPIKAWLIGLANAGISGIASSGISFGFGVKWYISLGIGAGAAGVSMIKWMVQHPIPGAAQ